MSRRAIVRTLRFGIGLVLLVTSAGKLADVRGFATVLETYRSFPEAALQPLAVGISAAELSLAIWLLSGRHLWGAAAASAAMHIAYAAFSAATLGRGIEIDNCGCFGVFSARPLTAVTVVEDLVMAALSLALLRLSAPPAKVE